LRAVTLSPGAARAADAGPKVEEVIVAATPGIGGGVPGAAGSSSGVLGEPRMYGGRIGKAF
jgi:hypothetical protein